MVLDMNIELSGIDEEFLENFAESEMLHEFWNSTPNIQISMIN